MKQSMTEVSPQKIVLSLASVVATVLFATLPCWASVPVKVSEGEISMPTYESSGRDLEPPLFADSAVGGLYPFVTYQMPLQASPKAKTYHAIFVENEYLKLTYLPEFGGRFMELYDKIRQRHVFYKNDVIKPTGFNALNSWPQEGIELTGPFDLHSPTLSSSPYWSHSVLHLPDGSVQLMLGETDPVYGMTVRYSATIHPGVAAMEISTFCFNPNDGRKPQMFWSNASFPTTLQTQFLYPMTRTVGHNTGQVTGWPFYEGVDYSYDRNNKNMLGVFGIDAYDNYGGAYMFDQDYGVFRYADRRVVQGMKMWTFGHGRDGVAIEQAYTDKAGPYYEAQSGRHVWDGHYEWVAPHQVESWSEWWIPVAGTKGLSTLTDYVALNARVEQQALQLDVAPVRAVPNASLEVRSAAGVLLKEKLSLRPETEVHRSVALPGQAPHDLQISVKDDAGKTLVEYRIPNVGEKRSEYTPFTLELEKPAKTQEQMSAEELVLAAESHLKDLDDKVGLQFLDESLKKDAGYSVAHELKGIVYFNEGRMEKAQTELQAAVARDPYADKAFYYLAVTQLALGLADKAERNFYFIWPNSAYYGNREYQLGRIEFLRKSYSAAMAHLKGAIDREGEDLSARQLLAMTYRESGDGGAAKSEVEALLKLDPPNRGAAAETFLATKSKSSADALGALMGDQTQEAMHVAEFYSNLQRWPEALAILQLVAEKNSDPFGTSAVFYDTLAYVSSQAGETALVAPALKKARATEGTVDRFPYLASSEAPLRFAIAADDDDALAHFNLACLLYSQDRKDEAIAQWEQAIKVRPQYFSAQRALGLAYSERGETKAAVPLLEKAVLLNPQHVATVNDLVTIYAQVGRFADERKLLTDALSRTEQKDDLMLRLLHVDLVQGRYDDAEEIVRTHTFSPRHRDYALRTEYRAMKYGEGSRAFHRGNYDEALKLFQAAETPPSNLGVDDFQFQSTPRLRYYVGRTLEAMGRKAEAAKAYEQSVKEADMTAGDIASYNTDNFYMLLSLEKLGRRTEAQVLAVKFDDFAKTQLALQRGHRRSEGKYLLGLVASMREEKAVAKHLYEEAVAIEPDDLMPIFDLRGDSIGSSIAVKAVK